MNNESHSRPGIAGLFIVLFLCAACGNAADQPLGTGGPSFGEKPGDNASAFCTSIPSGQENGSTCCEDSHCASEHCSSSPFGGVCTESCQVLEDCPQGFLCEVDPAEPSAGKVCLHVAPETCRPCMIQSDCEVPGHVPMVCRDVGGFDVCVPTCPNELPCPAGFECNSVFSAQGVPVCMPTSAECGCQDIHVGLSGSCKNTNDVGSCSGVYSCDEAGKKQCEADTPVMEVCDDLDNDCDGLIDEPINPGDVIGPCGPDSALSLGAGQSGAFDVSSENSFGLEETDEGFIKLSTKDVSGQHIWIANSGDSTVSKLNTQTGCEEGRYHAALDPSRTAVDLYGNGIIACRGGNARIIKIAGTEAYCTDKNGNGVIDTARDTNGNCTIENEEMVDDDECILWISEPNPGQTARAAGVDKENHIWVGFWGSQKLYRLSPEDGSVVKEIQLDEKPYGLVIDGDGIIWVATRDPAPHRLVKVHPEQGKIGSWPSPGASGHLYGIGIDAYGKIWVATAESQGVGRFDPLTSQWTHVWAFSGYGYTRGIVGKTDTDGNGNVVGSKIYVAHHTFGCSTDSEARTVTAIDASTMQVMGHIDLGGFRGPVGVAIDSEGYLWTVNQCDGELGTGSATKIDTNNWQIQGTYLVHASPYSYSDMTGYVLGTVTAPTGNYRATFESPDGRAVRWARIEVDVLFPPGAQTSISVRARVADELSQLSAATWSDVYGPYPPNNLPVELGPELAMGKYIEVELTLATDTQGLSPIVKSLGVVPQAF